MFRAWCSPIITTVAVPRHSSSKGKLRKQNSIQATDVPMIIPVSSELSKLRFSVNIPNFYMDTHRVRNQSYVLSINLEYKQIYDNCLFLKGNHFAFWPLHNSDAL